MGGICKIYDENIFSGQKKTEMESPRSMNTKFILENFIF